VDCAFNTEQAFQRRTKHCLVCDGKYCACTFSTAVMASNCWFVLAANLMNIYMHCRCSSVSGDVDVQSLSSHYLMNVRGLFVQLTLHAATHEI
jgi:hypothetical protein